MAPPGSVFDLLDPKRGLPSLQNPDWLASLLERAKKGIDSIPPGVLPGLDLGRKIGQIVDLVQNPIQLAPVILTDAAKYDHYKRILEARGYTVDPNVPTVLAIRGLSSDGSAHDTTSSKKYDDTIVVLTRGPMGEKVETFAGSTHPGQTTAAVGGTVGVPDVNKDGQADVGMINPGEYRLEHHGNHNGAAAWDVRTVDNSGVLPGVRDTDHDGNFTPAEGTNSSTRGDALTGVMIHQGAANSPQSAGCINLSSNPTVYPQFIQAIGGANQSAKLVVLDAHGV